MAQNQPDLRGKAEDWAGRNTDSDEAATFGGMRFEIALQPTSSTPPPWRDGRSSRPVGKVD
jgi:hypothetical protein